MAVPAALHREPAGGGARQHPQHHRRHGAAFHRAEGVAEAIPEAQRARHVNRAGRVGRPARAAGPGRGHPAFVPGMPLTDVKLVNIKLIALSELKLITDRGAQGRKRLAELFSAGSQPLLSSLERTPVL